MKRALIFGVGGQDGSYLAELLLEIGYEVHGTHRRSSCDNLGRIAGVRDRLTLHRCELTDEQSVNRAVLRSATASGGGVRMTPCPGEWVEVYNMADQDEVGWSHDTPSYSEAVTYGGAATVLRAVTGFQKLQPGCVRLFQPISSTVFGPTAESQDERTPLNPGSPYACAKAAAWLLCKHYRREHGLHVSCGVFFNHTSPRQPRHYLLPKIASQAVAVARGERDRIELDGPDVVMDVGWAPDYVEEAWKMLQRPEPSDAVIGTGWACRISELCAVASEAVADRRDLYALKDPRPVNGSVAKSGGLHQTPRHAAYAVQRLIATYRER